MQYSRSNLQMGYGAVLVVLLAGLAGCRQPPPEQAVRAQLQALQQAMDARDAGKIEDLLAEDFIGNDGMDRRAMRQLAAGSFLRYRDVAATLGPVNVALHGENDATATFNVLVAGSSGGLLPDSGQLYEVKTGWHRRSSEWRLRNAQWRQKL